MEFSERGIKLLATLEGFKAEPYKDSAGLWTIGDGTLEPLDNKGNPVILHVTPEEALKLLLDKCEPIVHALNEDIKVPVNQNQFDALVLFAYNIGLWGLRNSTLFALLNKGLYTSAADQFLRWNKAGGVVVKGLTNRREQEKALFLTK